LLFPIFLGYLASAVVFLFEGKLETSAPLDPDLLSLLTRGPFYATIALAIALFASFWYANSTDIPGSTLLRFPYPVFSSAFSAIVGIHTATTSALVAYLFGQEKRILAQENTFSTINERKKGGDSETNTTTPVQ
jgi:hypothetical protein